MMGSWVKSRHQTAWTDDTVLTLAKTQKGQAAALCQAVSADQEPAQTRAESQPWLHRAPILAWSSKEALRQTVSADLSLRKSPLSRPPTAAVQGKVTLTQLVCSAVNHNKLIKMLKCPYYAILKIPILVLEVSDNACIKNTLIFS